MLGSSLCERDETYLIAGPRLNVATIGCNGDIKFIQKHPVLDVTHEADVDPEEKRGCLATQSQRDMLVYTQSVQAVMCGYCGGHTSKAQDVGQARGKSHSEGLPTDP